MFDFSKNTNLYQKPLQQISFRKIPFRTPKRARPPHFFYKFLIVFRFRDMLNQGSVFFYDIFYFRGHGIWKTLLN